MNVKIRTVSMTDRGQIVIPEDMRKDLQLTSKESLILIEKGNEITIKKESDIAKKIFDEGKAWEKLAMESLKRGWEKEDDVWDKIAKEDMK